MNVSAQGHCCYPRPRASRTNTQTLSGGKLEARSFPICVWITAKNKHTHTQWQCDNCYWPENKSQAQKRVRSSRMNLEGWTEGSFGEFGGVRMCLAVWRQRVCQIMSRWQDRSLLTHGNNNNQRQNQNTTQAHPHTQKPLRTVGSVSLLMCLEAACLASSLSSYRMEQKHIWRYIPVLENGRRCSQRGSQLRCNIKLFFFPEKKSSKNQTKQSQKTDRLSYADKSLSLPARH